MQATINDIAREAGVSTATVSRVMNNSPKVSEATKERVRHVMEKYDYSPSFIARGLKSKSMKTIAVVVKKMTMLHHMRIATEINARFTELGFDVVIYETGSTSEGIQAFLTRMANRSIDGIIFIGSAFQALENVSDFNNILGKTPVVIANGWISGTYGIMVDEAAGCEMLVDQIASAGRTHMLFIHSNETNSTMNKMKGFLKKSEELKAEHNFHHVHVEQNEECKENLLSLIKNLAIDGIICEDDQLALGVEKLLLESGYHIPEDISLGSFNNSIYSSLGSPSITSVDNKPIEQGQLCAEVLEKLLEDKVPEDLKEKKVVTTLIPELVIRKSTLVH
ncbi:MAG: LacI family DNA-binding transcriptional regulator [Spirochaetales bacterium]|nr:LacI family DNA-binding transcriptional regulator [Candidatus Physcosoma equi]